MRISKRNYLKYLFTIMTVFESVQSKCVETFQLQCDTLLEIHNFNTIPFMDNYEWDGLQVGPNNCNGNIIPECITNEFNFTLIGYFKRIVIVNALSDIQVLGVRVNAEFTNNLKELIFYDNHLETLRTNAFNYFKLDKFILKNNNIQVMEMYAIGYRLDAKLLDLSNNKLTDFQHPIDSDCKILKLYIQHNELVYIEPGSFPKSLESLRLDYNQLSQLDENIFGDLENLKELTISNNGFTNTVNLSNLTNLERVDFSYNKMFKINEDHFKNLNNLHYVNFEGNKLKTFSFAPFDLGLARKKLFQISYNLLSFLNVNELKNTTNYHLAIYGNPWTCKCLQLMEMDMATKRNIKMVSCEFETKGSQPLCFNEHYPATMQPADFVPENYPTYRVLCSGKPYYFNEEVVNYRKMSLKRPCKTDVYNPLFLEQNYAFTAVV